MKTYSIPETLILPEFDKVGLSEYGKPDISMYHSYSIIFTIPAEARIYLHLSHYIPQWLELNESKLWMTVWTTYPPEDFDYFRNLRHIHGYDEQLIAKPVHLFESKERDYDLLEKMLLCMMAFNWEGYLFQRDLETIIWMADEVIDISTNSLIEYQSILTTLEHLSITPFESSS